MQPTTHKTARMRAALVAALVAVASCAGPAAATPRLGFHATNEMELGSATKMTVQANAAGTTEAKIAHGDPLSPDVVLQAPAGSQLKPSNKLALSIGPGSSADNPLVVAGSPDSAEARLQVVGRDWAGIVIDTVEGGVTKPGASLTMSAGDKDLKISAEGPAGDSKASVVLFEPYVVPGQYRFCAVRFQSQPCAAEAGEPVLYLPGIESDFGGLGRESGSCTQVTGTTVANEGNAFRVHENERMGRFEIHNTSPHAVTVRATLHGRVRRHTLATATPPEVNRLRFYVRRQDELTVGAVERTSSLEVFLPAHLGEKSFNVQRILEVPPGNFVMPTVHKDTNTTAKIELDMFMRLEQMI